MHKHLAMSLAIVLASCGKNAPAAKDDAPPAPSVAPITVPTIGVEQIRHLNFGWAEGPCEKAYKATPRDWTQVRSSCEAALAKDPHNLDLHRLLALALAQTNEHAAAVEHLIAMLRADYFGYAAELTTNGELKEFIATQHGQSLTALAAKLREAYQKTIASSIWLVGRRSTFKWPNASGVQPSTSRGEVYAYDRGTKRYLRLTHTDHKVVGFVRAPSGLDIAVLGFDKIDRPKDDGPPTFANAWVQLFDTTEWKPLGSKISLPASREIVLGYAAGDQLLVSSAPADGRWGVGTATVSSVDKSAGRLTKVGTPIPQPRIIVTLDESRLVRDASGVEAVWTSDPTSPTLKVAGGATIQIPESGAASESTVAVSPGNAKIAFATAVDPCSKDTAPSLYVADVKSGALKHVLTAPSRFATRWVDAATLAYEDGAGAIRLWDAASSRESGRLENKAGIALDVLSTTTAPLCKQAPPVVESVGAGSGDELPPEEGSAGPITAPQ
ncbi:MAG: hypothetical protein AB7O24_24265 [Kofleriaceae bacterium]